MRLGRDRRIGTTLASRWRLDRKIGSGGVASVFAATDVRDGRAVAVKVLHDDLSDDQEVRRRFLREGVVVNRIDHPGVVHVEDAGTDGDRTYLVMDLLAGKTLKETWQAAGETLPAAEVVRYVCRALDIVVAAHAAGVLHRDLKSDNIFITESGELRLLDFGIARLRDPGKVDENATAAGSMLGTPACMPPEQALGKWDEVDERADVYAMGATAFRMLTGKPIHEATSLPELLMAVASKPARPIRSVSQSIPARLASVIDRALAFDKAARWSSAAEMLAALRATTLDGARDAPSSSATHDWAQPLSLEPTTDRMEEAPDSAGPTVARLVPPLAPPPGPTVLSSRARTVLMPPHRQNATLASAHGALITNELEPVDGATKRLGAEVMGEVLEAVGQSKRSKAQSATAALIAATSGPRRAGTAHADRLDEVRARSLQVPDRGRDEAPIKAGTIPMPPSVDARYGSSADAAKPPGPPRTVEMPRAPATELLEAPVATPPAPPATVLLERSAPAAPATVLLDAAAPHRPSSTRADEPDDDELGQPTRVHRATAPRPGAALATASQPRARTTRWLLLVLAVVAGAVAAWLLFRARGG